MNTGLVDARCLSGHALAEALRESRARTLAWTFDLEDAQWLPPEQPGVNPLAWELAHLAWFGEFWVLRGPHAVDAAGLVNAARPARIAGPDALFDSARLPHAERWRAPLPTRAELTALLEAQLGACLAALADRGDDDAALYFHRLALFHEDMHGEAFAWMRAALRLPAPAGVALPRCAPGGSVALPATEFALGWPAGRRGFAFDNECAAHTVALPAFEIDAAPVSAGRYLEFVEAEGYGQAALWPGEAGRWRAQQAQPFPGRWRRAAAGWQVRWFDVWLPLDPQQPAIHLCAWEAEAFARWAGRRLPSAAEWEHAAIAQPERFRWGHGVWEWTTSAFEPYPGFAPGPYRDYSAPWFGEHRELRGGAFATHARLHHARYRNFFLPARTDAFAGFRTAAS